MSGIRPLRDDDLAAVADLFEIRRSGVRRAPDGMEAHLRRHFVTGPDVDPEIPSLVVEGEGGAVTGFLGSTVRPMRCAGRRLRMAVTGPLFTEPGKAPIAAFLLRHIVTLGQDLTISDRHNLAAHRLFVAVGASVAHVRCVRWTALFRPIALHAHARTSRRLRATRFLVRPVAEAADRLASAARRPAPPPPARVEPLTPLGLCQALDAVALDAPLMPVYEPTRVAHTFEHLASLTTLGALTPVLLRDERDRVLGWYIFLLLERGVSLMIQAVARPGADDTVLSHLFDHARRGGSHGLRGRAEPRHLMALRDRNVRLDQGACLLVHAADEQVRRAALADDALLTALDGEPWVAEAFDAGRASHAPPPDGWRG